MTTELPYWALLGTASANKMAAPEDLSSQLIAPPGPHAEVALVRYDAWPVSLYSHAPPHESSSLYPLQLCVRDSPGSVRDDEEGKGKGKDGKNVTYYRRR